MQARTRILVPHTQRPIQKRQRYHMRAARRGRRLYRPGPELTRRADSTTYPSIRHPQVTAATPSIGGGCALALRAARPRRGSTAPAKPGVRGAEVHADREIRRASRRRSCSSTSRSPGSTPRSRNELWRLLDELAHDGATILLTTDLEEAGRLADSVVVLDHGRGRRRRPHSQPSRLEIKAVA